VSEDRGGGSVEERAAWDAFVRDAFARSSDSLLPTETRLDEILLAADRMIAHRRQKFPPKPSLPR
jgi:hypothetical protein